MKHLLFGLKVVQVDQYVMATCNATQYKSLYLRLDDHWFEIKPSSFLLNATYQFEEDQSSDWCTIGIIPQVEKYVVLGNTFLRNYYVIFDMEMDRVGISN